MLEAIDDALEHEPTLVVVCNTGEDPAKAAWFVDQLVARGTDGIIIVAHDPLDPSGAPISRVPALLPTVVVDWPTAPDPVVLFDMHGAGHQAAAHLIEHGHERIGVITPPTAPPSVAETHAGIHAALRDASLTLQPEYLAHVPDFSTPSGTDGAERLLALDPPPTAILALGDQLAIGVLHTAHSLGLTIPTGLALVSMETSPSPPTSTRPSPRSTKTPPPREQQPPRPSCTSSTTNPARAPDSASPPTSSSDAAADAQQDRPLRNSAASTPELRSHPPARPRT